jgi:hypothetical protein
MGGGLMTYKIFTNDRGKEWGVPMYSALTTLTAGSLAGAELKAGRRFACFGPPEYAPIKAIEWPPTSQASKDWLAKHT